MYKRSLYLVAILMICTHSYGQSSFFKVLEEESMLFTDIPLYGLSINSEGSLSYLINDDYSIANLAKLSNNGVLLNGKQIIDLETDGNWRIFHKSLKSISTWNSFTAGNSQSTTGNLSALFVVNSNLEIVWSKQLSNKPYLYSSSLITTYGKIFCSTYPFTEDVSPASGLARFDLVTGNQEWGYFYKKAGGLNRLTTINNINEITNERLSALTLRRIPGKTYRDASIIVIDISGVLLHSNAIIADSIDFLSHEIDSQSNIYLTGKKIGPLGNGIIDTDGIIVKLDANYEVLWAKKLRAEQFDFFDLKIEFLANDNLIFSYTTLGNLPVITGEISSTGELLWHKGYAFAVPQVAVAEDGSIYLSSIFLFNTDGSYERAHVLAKTDQNGDIAGCPQFDACLRLEDIEVSTEETEWIRSDAAFLPSIEVGIEALEFTSYDTCGVPAHPEAEFYFPDTLCQYSCVSPDSLKNSLANHVDWTIIGPGVDTLITGESFEWCFDSIGIYTVEQEIWLLGCSEFYSKNVEVLADDLMLDLGEDQYICENEAYEIVPSANRPLRTFLWNSGNETSSLSVLQAGDYSLTATDGFCTDSSSIHLSLIDDLLDEEPLFVPADTVVCPDLLPYILRPLSPYSNRFYLNGDVSMTDSVFQLTKAGVYNVETMVENCVFSELFELTIEPCEIPIYFANVFSPNDDGVNDEVFPQGQDFEGVQLSVFNRWGDLVYETNQAPYSWNGKFGNQKQDTGVYVLVFTYFNRRNLKEEVVSNDVLLLR